MPVTLAVERAWWAVCDRCTRRLHVIAESLGEAGAKVNDLGEGWSVRFDGDTLHVRCWQHPEEG